MTTTTVHTIGSGGDYSTLQSWEDAAPADLVTSDIVWQGQVLSPSDAFTASLTVSGSTDDATRYKELTCGTGASFIDNASVQTNALRFNASNGASLALTASYAIAVTISENYFRMSRMQVQSSGGGNRAPAVVSTGTGVIIDNCILEGKTGDNAWAPVKASNLTLRNSLVVNLSSSASGSNIFFTGGTNYLYNCTIAKPSDLTQCSAMKRSYATVVLENCALFGSAMDSTSVTATTCYTNVASPPTGFTTIAYDTSTGSGFENITNATRDYRIKSGSAMLDVGTTDTTNAATDIVGTARPQGSAYDVGAWELVSAGGPTAYTQDVAGALVFSGARNAGTTRAIAANASFIGTQAKSTGRVFTAALSFIGTQTRSVSRVLSATLTFIGAQAKSINHVLTAALAFIGSTATLFSGKLLSIYVGMLGKTTSRLGAFSLAGKPGAGTYLSSLTAALTFIGTQTKSTSRVFTAALAFIGILTRAFPVAFTATLAFIGAQAKSTGRALSATLAFIGAQAKKIDRVLTATLAFVGVLTRAFPVTFTAALAFSGTVTRSITRLFTAALSFIGDQVKSISHVLSATLSFIGNMTKTTYRVLSATLTLSGVMTIIRLITMALTATLSFIGAQTRVPGKIFSAILNTAGNVGKKTNRFLSGVLAYSGAVTKTTNRALSAALSFIGVTTTTRLITVAFAAALSFSGAISKQTGRALNAVLSWIGSISMVYISGIIQIAFTAALTFSGAQTKHINRSLVATLNFIGTVNKRLSRAFAALVSFVGGLLGSIFVVNVPRSVTDVFVLKVEREVFIVKTTKHAFVLHSIFETLIIRRSTDKVVF